HEAAAPLEDLGLLEHPVQTFREQQRGAVGDRRQRLRGRPVAELIAPLETLYEVERAVRQLDAGGGEGVHVGHVLDHEAGPVPAPHQRGQSRGGRERRVEREQRVGALCAVLRGGVVQLRRGEAGEGVEAEGDQVLGRVGEGGRRGGGEGSAWRGRARRARTSTVRASAVSPQLSREIRACTGAWSEGAARRPVEALIAARCTVNSSVASTQSMRSPPSTGSW